MKTLYVKKYMDRVYIEKLGGSCANLYGDNVITKEK